MKVEQTTAMREQVNFLKSEKFISVSGSVPQSKGTAFESRKIVKAGTILPSNDAQAKGILLEDVDVTAGDAVGALLISGIVIASRLPEAPQETAKTALKEIKFM